jgi:hypothetical protein
MAAQAPLLRIGLSKFHDRSFSDFQIFLSVPHWNGLSALSNTVITGEPIGIEDSGFGLTSCGAACDETEFIPL